MSAAAQRAGYALEGPALDAGQREVLDQALADAIAWREPTGLCTGCEGSLAAVCDDHASDLTLCEAYLLLAGELGIEVPT